MGTTPYTLMKYALLAALAAPLFGAYGYAVSGFGTKEGVLVPMIGVLVVAVGIASVALVTWVIAVGVRGGRQD